MKITLAIGYLKPLLFAFPLSLMKAFGRNQRLFEPGTPIAVRSSGSSDSTIVHGRRFAAIVSAWIASMQPFF
jgi:hypothetical protein